MNYEWKPGAGPDRQALLRLQKHFPRPAQAMGEAWFMGERVMYDYLKKREPGELSLQELSAPLTEIASGIASFGRMREWSEWIRYLLPRLVPVSMDAGRRELQELLVTAIIAEFGSDLSERRYPEFRSDVLRTLGACIMDGSKWRGDDALPGRVLFLPPAEDCTLAQWSSASGDLSSSLLFCLKYLEPEEVSLWTASVLAIPDPYWRAQLLVWMFGASTMLETPGIYPDQVESQWPAVTWESSYILKKPEQGVQTDFLPAQNKAIFMQMVKQTLTAQVLDEWKRSIAGIDWLSAQCMQVVDMLDLDNLTGAA